MNLLTLKKKKKITQREAAEVLGISLYSYGRYERGDREPNIEMLIKMANLFDTTVDYVIGNPANLKTNQMKEYEKELIEAAKGADERAITDAIALLNRNRK